MLTGCAAYTAALYGTGPASADFVQCSKDNAGHGQIPDFGITYNKHFAKCMQEAGWEQDPEKPKGPGWGPTAYRRVQP
jgi:hypothetical protein